MVDPTQVNPAGNQALVTPGGTTTQGGGTQTQSSGDSAIMDQIQSRLLNQSDVISSASTGLESKVNDIVSGLQTGEKANEQSITLNYNQQEQQAQDTGTQALTSAQEATRGFATNYAALQRIQDTTTKNIQNLETQKQSLILQGQANAATQISNLQIQSLQYQQQAQQQVFTNLLNLSNNAQQAFQFQQTYNQNQSAQTFTEQQAITSTALKYGLSVGPNDTLASITTKAMPYASAEEQSALKLQQAQINEANANAQKALSDAQSGSNVNVGLLSDLYAANPSAGNAILANVKDPNVQAEIIQQGTQKQYNQIATNDVNNGVAYPSARSSILSNTTMSGAEQATALAAVDAAYTAAGKMPAPGQQSGTSLPIGTPDFTSSQYKPVPLTPAQQAAAVAALSKALQGTAFSKK